MEMNVHSSLLYELVRDEIHNIIINGLKYLTLMSHLQVDLYFSKSEISCLWTQLQTNR